MNPESNQNNQYNGSGVPTTQQPYAMPPQTPGPEYVGSKDPGKGLAIASIVLFLFFNILGLVLGIIAKGMSKKAGFKNTLATVGIVLNAVSILFSVIITIFIVFALFLPVAQARNAAIGFTNAIRDGNYEKAFSYTDIDAKSKADALTYFAALKPAIGTSQSEIDRKDGDDGSKVLIYSIQDGTSKFYRVIVKDQKVTQADVSSEPFTLSGGKTSQPSVAENNSTNSGAVAQSSQTCKELVGADFQAFYLSAAPDVSIYTDNAFFNADAVTYQFPSTTTAQYAKYAAFHKSITKPYTIILKGSVYKDYQTQAGVQLAQQRAEKVKQELINVGIPAGNILIAAPQEYPYGQSTDPSVFRNVDIRIESNCP